MFAKFFQAINKTLAPMKNLKTAMSITFCFVPFLEDMNM